MVQALSLLVCNVCFKGKEDHRHHQRILNCAEVHQGLKGLKYNQEPGYEEPKRKSIRYFRTVLKEAGSQCMQAECGLIELVCSAKSLR